MEFQLGKSILRHLTLIILVLGSVSFMSGCKELNAKSRNKGMTPDCFTQLHPGIVRDGKMDAVAFQNGVCIGEYKALNVMSVQNQVVVDRFGNMELSDILVNGNEVVVNSGGNMIKIADLERTRTESRLHLAHGVDFRLMVNAGGTHMPWHMGMMPGWTDEKIVLSIRQ